MNSAPRSSSPAVPHRRLTYLLTAAAVLLLLAAYEGYRKAGADSGPRVAAYILSGGLLFGLLLFAVVRSRIHARREVAVAAAELRRSEMQYRTLIEQSPLSTQILAPDGRTLRVNRAWEELWGVTLDKLGDYNMLEDRQLVEKGIMPYIKRGFEGEAVEVPAVMYDPEESIPGLTEHENAVRWVSAVIYPVKDEAGAVREVVLVHEDITEQKRAERELQESEARFRTLIEAVFDGVVIHEGGTILEANKGFAAMFGYAPDEIIGKTILELVTEDCRESVLEKVRSGDEEPYEVAGLRKDGGTFNLEVTGKAHAYRGRSVRVSALRDITERKRAEESRTLHSRVLENMVEGVSLSDERGIILYTNQAEDEMFGYERGELVGRHVSVQNTYAPQENARIVGEVIEQLKQQGAWFGEFSNLRKDGTPFTTFARITALEIGGRNHWVCVQEDITERKRAEEALRRSEERYERAAEAGKVGVWDLNLESGDLYLSANLKALLGYADDELANDMDVWCELVHPEDRERVKAATRAHLEGESPRYEVEVRRRHKDGRYLWFVAQGIALRDAGGQPHKLTGSDTEVTERKQLEEQLRARAEQLADANRLKDEFLATLSHELRTPLTSVLGWAKLLRTEKFDSQTSERALETIERNAQAQAQLINDLLDVSRIITGKLRLNVEVVELASVIEAAVDSVRLAAEARGVELRINLDSSSGSVSGDPDRLQQVCWNLLSNAIKFTPRGGRVEVRLVRAGHNVEFSINDTGQGITPAFLPHVFERFRQADGAITRRHGGLGLGLAIVRHLVELHGGTIRAESEGAGRGASFHILLPSTRARVPHVEAEPAAAPSGASAGGVVAARGRLEGVRVVLVDDDEDSRVLLSSMLEAGGAKVVTASSAAEGFDAVKRLAPDVIVSDIGMPGEDGYELIRKVRALDAGTGGHTPAAALTAYARTEDREQALAAGYELHVVKPVEPVELIAAVAHLCGRNVSAWTLPGK